MCELWGFGGVLGCLGRWTTGAGVTVLSPVTFFPLVIGIQSLS
jgi:hypothetical protein